MHETTAVPLSEVVDRLDADTIRARLDALEAERRALMPLLRAARARDRARRMAAPVTATGKAVPHGR